jgi:hypothetical protein
METQLALPLQRPDRTTAADDADTMASWLSGRGWLTAAAITASLGWPERRIRAAASASAGRILSSPGQPGYCLTRESTADDRDRALRALRSQARQMLSRWVQISRVHRAAGHV